MVFPPFAPFSVARWSLASAAGARPESTLPLQEEQGESAGPSCLLLGSPSSSQERGARAALPPAQLEREAAWLGSAPPPRSGARMAPAALVCVCSWRTPRSAAPPRVAMLHVSPCHCIFRSAAIRRSAARPGTAGHGSGEHPVSEVCLLWPRTTGFSGVGQGCLKCAVADVSTRVSARGTPATTTARAGSASLRRRDS